MNIVHTAWVICPVCGSKTRTKIRPDTVLENFPLFCPKCKQETLISAKQMKVFRQEKAVDNWGNKKEILENWYAADF